MNELKVFQNTEFGELSVMTIDGKEYFPATQCANILGYSNPKDAILRHCKGVVKHDLPTNGGNQTVNYIPEGDLYRLIIRSKLPGAERFERWVFDEVLPSLRKTGMYMPDIESIIAKSTTLAVTEAIKQLLPLISTHNNSYKPIAKKHSVAGPPSVIEQLNDELKEEVHRMMQSGLYSSQSIAEFLSHNGIRLSLQAICKYKKKHFIIIE